MWRIIAAIMWVAGVVLAQGFWSTVLALLIPFWAWYLVIEAAMKYFGVI